MENELMEIINSEILQKPTIGDLKLFKSEKFHNLTLDMYKDGDNIWVTREQIGAALEYANPTVSISNLHLRNPELLDYFSGVIKLITPSGGNQETFVYSAPGIYEICRCSRQKNADIFQLFIYCHLEKIRKEELLLLNTKTKELEKIVDDGKPKVDFYDKWRKSENYPPVGIVAKILGFKYVEFFKRLRENKILVDSEDKMIKNTPTNYYSDKGYFVVGIAKDNFPQTSVTQSGFEFLKDISKNWDDIREPEQPKFEILDKGFHYIPQSPINDSLVVHVDNNDKVHKFKIGKVFVNLYQYVRDNQLFDEKDLFDIELNNYLKEMRKRIRDKVK